MSFLHSLTSRHALPLAAAIVVTAAGLAMARFGVHLPALPRQIDLGVVVLFVPACALFGSILAEAILLVANGGLPDEPTPLARAIPHWQENDA